MTRLKIGYLLPTRELAVRGEHDLAPLVTQARRAEQLGLDSVWAGDGPVTRQRADPLLLLASAAQATERVTLGTAVLLPALRHPILLAQQFATLDRLSGGRLIAGLGGGFPNPATRVQFAALGIGFGTRMSRMEESIDAMRQLWSGRTVSYKGDHFAFEDLRIAPSPSRSGGPPIWLAASGAAGLRRVARLADGWLPYPPTAAAYAQDRAFVERAAEQAAPSRAVTPALYTTLCLDEDQEVAQRRLRASVERYYNAPFEFIASLQAVFAGTPGQAAAWLSGYIEAGARHLVIRLATDDHAAGLEELADQVLPLLRAKDR
ncbi:LLM class flavin-dependent oxidoreductase [Streptomyces sp. NPDC059378]|uniref:LLM class flavin-dependent oxidoreductase n=1 Tax=Streptomyces sp. NPDC059378 TaxID=3346815 RepID=UPI0036757D8C